MTFVVKKRTWLKVTMQTNFVSCKKILQLKIQVPEKLKKINWCFYQIVLFVARKNRLSLKIKNSTILIIFKMISLKWIKSLTNFCWPEANYARIEFKAAKIFLYCLLRHLLNIVKKFKNLKKHVVKTIM